MPMRGSTSYAFDQYFEAFSSLGTIMMNTSRAGRGELPCQRNDGAYDDEDHGGRSRV